ncbi:hypothetical protein [Halomarina litorea]|uniref:hypothetical protein n=1 Tax=Halomarina litorea TaxID=2961595 RepID=UPI0020C1C7A4|nr:hypothetical protein [Halomarina sp. BCD28]
MTRDDDGPTTPAELQHDLQRLFRRAHRNGVAVTGGWEVRDENGRTVWDVHVTDVVRRDPVDADTGDGREWPPILTSRRGCP